VLPHGLVTGNTISSPTVFVGFGAGLAYGDGGVRGRKCGRGAEIAVERRVPFGWNSWYAYGME